MIFKSVFLHRRKLLSIILAIFVVGSFSFASPIVKAQSLTTHFAVIGDYGYQGQPESDVAALVKSWNPEFMVTTGDNNYGGNSYPPGSAETIDANIGQYYQDFIYPYSGSYGSGATENLFFPVMGNHDWDTTNGQAYFDYFSLPNNERYYDFIKGPVHFFMVDSDPREPDGNTSTSIQATWLKNALANSTEAWNIVILHHAPFSSAEHGSNLSLQWPYQAWGADAVISGHDHTYERVVQNNFPYFVNGLGGRSIYNFGTPITGSAVRYSGNYGAMLVDADEVKVTFQFIDISGNLIDSYTIDKTQTKSFYSTAVQDGNVLELNETAEKGGYVFGGTTTIRVGDDAMDRNYRGILSFNTAGLPDTAIILDSRIVIRKSSGATNPLGGLQIDIRSPFFGGGIGLATNDWQAAPSMRNATLAPDTSTAWYVFSLIKAANPFINKIGTTQFRIQTALEDNDNGQVNSIYFYSAEATQYKPKLIIKYYQP